ncbi:aminodeoxychorismate lyase [Thaumasiovibrio sp. DFM-14]|uniref:aminodeoxychorismate lyase n=1 Tax=Thaumasiovibrio sp. DFM-14 TaxID=3384792 RepID=UPI0039A2E1F9
MQVQIATTNNSALSVNDRGFQYGDGCFSTIAVRHGQPLYWDYHAKRFEQTLSRLRIDAIDFARLRGVVEEQARGLGNSGVIKVTITRGEGGRGYSSAADFTPNVVITTAMMPPTYATLREQGIALGLCNTQLGLNPLLAGMKHLNRLEQVLVRQEIDHQHWQDAVVCNLNGHVVETGIANLFWEQGNQLYTPDLSLSGVAGVMRQVIIDQANRLNIAISEVAVKPEHLLSVESVFVSNSLMMLVPVIEFNGHHYKKGKIFSLLAKSLYCD